MRLPSVLRRILLPNLKTKLLTNTFSTKTQCSMIEFLFEIQQQGPLVIRLRTCSSQRRHKISQILSKRGQAGESIRETELPNGKKKKWRLKVAAGDTEADFAHILTQLYIPETAVVVSCAAKDCLATRVVYGIWLLGPDGKPKVCMLDTVHAHNCKKRGVFASVTD